MTDTTTPIDFDALTPTTDIYGNALTVGTRVRSFNTAVVYDDEITGLDQDGDRARYVDGVIEAIGTETIEGCPRYRIRYDRSVFGGDLDDLTSIPAAERLVYPPLNGTPTLLGRHTFGVIALPADAGPDRE